MAKNKESNLLIFSLSFAGKDPVSKFIEGDGVKPVKLEVTNPNSPIADKDRIFNEIIEESAKQNKIALLNMHFASNLVPPIFEIEDLRKFKALNIQLSFTFDQYKPDIAKELKNVWQSFFTQVDHIFIEDKNDNDYALSQGIISEKQNTSIKIFSDPSINLNDNILLFNMPVQFEEIVKAAKELNSRVIVVSSNMNVDEITKLFASKFGVTEEDQKLGIKLEIEEILKDKINAPKNLERYIKQLSEQFQTDKRVADINPVDIYFDLSSREKLQEIYRHAKYTIDSGNQGSMDVTNNCIPLNLKIISKENIIGAIMGEEENKNENKMPPLNSSIPPLDFEEVKGAADQSSPEEMSQPGNIFTRIFNGISNLLKSIKETIFGKKEDVVIPQTPRPTIQAPANTASKIVATPDELTQGNYLYSEDDINKLLKASLGDKKVSIIEHASLAEVERGLLKDTFVYSIKDLKEQKFDSVLMPLATDLEGKHWVSMMITYNKDDNQLIFTHNDPLGRSINNNLETLIKELDPNAIIIDLAVNQQKTNGYDCGVYITDNLIKLANGQEILSEQQSGDSKGVELRAQHAEILNNEVIKQQAKEAGRQIPPLPQTTTSYAAQVLAGRNNSSQSNGRGT